MVQKIIDKYRRLQARWRIISRHGKELNRRVTIENELLAIAKGDAPLPTKDQCRVMALKLGTPVEYWREDWR